ncbi:HTH_48 domain-containing protein [Trichonephila clavipes]|nr:HTH_48 domain-containing protein [Trichonephila clavipes]
MYEGYSETKVRIVVANRMSRKHWNAHAYQLPAYLARQTTPFALVLLQCAKNISAAEIHRQISDVYSSNAMSSSKVRKWVRAYKDGWENVHDEPLSSGPSVITDDLVNAVDEKIREDRRFTIST